jgi:hypothetical protein
LEALELQKLSDKVLMLSFVEESLMRRQQLVRRCGGMDGRETRISIKWLAR